MLQRFLKSCLRACNVFRLSAIPSLFYYSIVLLIFLFTMSNFSISTSLLPLPTGAECLHSVVKWQNNCFWIENYCVVEIHNLLLSIDMLHITHKALVLNHWAVDWNRATDRWPPGHRDLEIHFFFTSRKILIYFISYEQLGVVKPIISGNIISADRCVIHDYKITMGKKVW